MERKPRQCYEGARNSLKKDQRNIAVKSRGSQNSPLKSNMFRGDQYVKKDEVQAQKTTHVDLGP